MTLEVYILLRLMWFIAPGFLSLRHRLAAIGDARALRTASLILLELLTVIPGIKFVGIVAEFIPFAIGSLCVLGERGALLTIMTLRLTKHRGLQ
jgi:hypothetical protein